MPGQVRLGKLRRAGHVCILGYLLERLLHLRTMIICIPTIKLLQFECHIVYAVSMNKESGITQA